MKKVIYTVLFDGGYKYSINEPLYKTKGWDYCCITNHDLVVKDWDVIYAHEVDDPVLWSRYYKILPHNEFDDYDLSIYVDSRFTIKCDLDAFIEKNLTGNIAVMKHNRRDCVFNECKYLKIKEKHKSIWHMRRMGMPENFGLFAPGIMIRRHNDSEIREFDIDWWTYFFDWHIMRDQISLAYTFWRTGIMPDLMPFKETYELFMDRG